MVGDRLGLGDAPGLADVDADHARGAIRAAAEPAGRGGGAAVVEAEAVDERAVARQAEQPRPGVAGLRLGGDGADLDEAEAEREQRADPPGVLVEAGGQAERAGQLAAERADAEHRIARREQPAHQRGDPGDRGERAQHRERDPVRALGGQPLQHQPVQEAIHRAGAR